MRSRKTRPAFPAILFIGILVCFWAFMCLSGPLHEADASAAPLFGSVKVRLTAGDFPVDSQSLTAVIQPADVAMLGHFAALRSADFSGSTCYDEIYAWAEQNPGVEVVYSVALPDGSVLKNTDTAIDLSSLKHSDVESAAAALKNLPDIQSVTLGQVGRDSEALALGDLKFLRDALPQAKFDFSLSLLGQQVFPDETAIDLTALTHDSVSDAAAVLSCLSELKSITLGAESTASGALTWEDIGVLSEACPDVALDYSFTLYGKDVNLRDTELDLNHIEIKDEGAAVKKVLPYMRSCTSLDMDTTGVSHKAMAQIQDENPDVKVVWRVWFGENYSVRTDTERVLASKPTVGGMISDASVLQYCTDIKYLDLGHNDELADLSFVSSMPKLEVLIIAMTAITDISPLSNCPELNYLELNSTNVADISVLAGCTKLRDMNIGDCPKLKDISALYDIPMDRLWIGCNTPIPEAQVATMKSSQPACTINTTTFDPHGESWRYTRYDPEEPKYYWVPRYELIREQMGYNYQEYSFYWLDPKCGLSAPAEFAGMYGKEVYS